MDASNPLLPAAYDVVWTATWGLAVVLAAVAFVLLVRSARRLTALQALGWTLLIFLVPVLGPIAWLAIGRRADASRIRDGDRDRDRCQS